MRCAQKAIVSLLLLVFARGMHAQAVEHNALRPDANCSSCHGDKTNGKVVHSAMALGCAVCHRVIADAETASVDLTMPKEQLCFTCHQKSGEEYQHLPYAKGLCVSCHDPHSSNYPMHLRAEVNTLCLGCHAPQGVEGDKGQEAGNQPRPGGDSQGSRFDSALQAIHHSSERFLALMSVLQTGRQPVTCISCHQAHSSQESKLMRKVIGTGR